MPEIRTRRSTGMNIIRNIATATGGAINDYFQEAMPTTTNTAKGLINTIDTGTELIGKGLRRTTDVARLLYKELSFRKILGWFTREESDLDDFGFDDFDSSFSFGEENESSDSNENLPVITEEAKSANKVAKSVVGSSHKLVEAQIATAATTITSIDAQTKTIAQGFTQTNEILNKILEITTKNTASLVEATLSAGVQKNYQSINQSPERVTDDFVRSRGFNFENYKKVVKQNFGNDPQLAMMFSMAPMIFGLLDNDMIMKQFLSRDSLASGGFSLAMDHFFPNIKDMLKTIDEGIGNAIMDGLLALGEYGKNGNGGFLGTIGKFFGVSPEKETYSPSRKNIELGPVPFDGMTKEAITNVIPGYLQQILVALGGPDRQYDYESRKFMTAEEMRKMIMGNITNDTFENLSDDLKKVIAGNEAGIANKKDKYIIENLMQSLMNDYDLSGTINSFKNKKELENYIKHNAFSNIKIDDVLKEAIPLFSERLSSALNKQGLDFDLFRSVQNEKSIANSLIEQENAKQNVYDRNIDFVFEKNKRDNLEKRYLASQLGIEYIEDKDENKKKENNLENILSEDSTFVNIITSPLDYASRALYEIYRRLNTGINVFKVGEYNKNASEYQYKKFEYDNVLKEPEGYNPLALKSSLGSSAPVGKVINKIKDVWAKNQESNEEMTEEEKIEKRWQDDEENDPFAFYDVIHDQDKGRQNLLLNGKDEELSGSDRLGRFAKSAFGSIFSALVRRDPKQMKAVLSNIRSDLKGYGLKGIIKDTFEKEVVDGFGRKIGTYLGDTENINKYNEAEKALRDDFDAYQQAAFNYKKLSESNNEKTEEELNEAKERFLIAKQAAEESFKAAGIEGAFDIDLGNKDARHSESIAVQTKLLHTLTKLDDFENKNKAISDQMAKISKMKENEESKEDDLLGLARIALHQKGTRAINPQSPQGGPEDTISNPLNKDAIITSLPGYRNFGGELDYHTGTDLAAADGSKHVPIISQQSGIVSNILKNVPENGGDVDSYKGKYPSSGNFVEIQSPQGGPEDTIKTSYMHMEPYSTNLNIGDKVEAGDIIGRTGSSGRSTGDHLHYEQSILPSGGPEDENKSTEKIVENEAKELEQNMSFKKLQERAMRDAYRRSVIKTSTITGGIIGLMMGGPIGGAIAAGIGNLTSRLDVNSHVSTILFGEKNAKNKDGILKPYTQALKDSVLGGVGDILKQVGYSAFNYYINPFRNLSRVLYMRMVYGKNGKESIFDQMHKAFSFATGKIHNIFGTVLDEVKEHFTGLTNIIGEISSGFKNVIVDNLITPVKNFLEEHKDNVIVKSLTYIANIPKRFTSWVGKQFGKLFGGLFKGIGNFFGLNKFKEKGLLGGLFSAIGTTAKNVLPLAMFASNPLLGAGLLGVRLAAHRIGKFTKGNKEGSLDANQEIHNERLAEQADLGVISEETAQRKMIGGNNENSNETENSTQPVVDATDRTTEAVKELGPTIGDKLKELGERIIAAIKSIRPQEQPSSGGPKINISSLNKQNIGGPEKENNNSAGWFTTLLTSILSIPGGLSERAARIVTGIGGVLSSGKASLTKLKSFLPSLIRTSKDEHSQSNGTRSIGSIFGWLKNKITGNKKDDKNDDKENNGKEKSGGIFNTLKNIITGPLGKMSLGAGLLMLTDRDSISKGLDVAWGGLTKAGSWLLESGASIFGFAKEKAKDLGSFIMAASDSLWEKAKESVSGILDGNSKPLKGHLDWASTNFTRMAGLSFILGSGTLGKFFLRGAISTYALKKFIELSDNNKISNSLKNVTTPKIADDIELMTKDAAVAGIAGGIAGKAGFGVASIGLGLKNLITNVKKRLSGKGTAWQKASGFFDDLAFSGIETGLGSVMLHLPGGWPLLLGSLSLWAGREWIINEIASGEEKEAEKIKKRKEQGIDENGKLTNQGLFDELGGSPVNYREGTGFANIVNKSFDPNSNYLNKDMHGKLLVEMENEGLSSPEEKIQYITSRAKNIIKRSNGSKEQLAAIYNTFAPELNFARNEGSASRDPGYQKKIDKLYQDALEEINVGKLNNEELNEYDITKPILYRLPHGILLLVEKNMAGDTSVVKTSTFHPLFDYSMRSERDIIRMDRAPKKDFGKNVKSRLKELVDEIKTPENQKKIEQLGEEDLKNDEEFFLLTNNLNLDDVREISLYDDKNNLDLSKLEDYGMGGPDIGGPAIMDNQPYINNDHSQYAAAAQNPTVSQPQESPKTTITSKPDSTSKETLKDKIANFGISDKVKSGAKWLRDTTSNAYTTVKEKASPYWDKAKQIWDQQKWWGNPLGIAKPIITSKWHSDSRPSHAGIDIAGGVSSELRNRMINDRSVSSKVSVLSTVSGTAKIVRNGIRSGWFNGPQPAGVNATGNEVMIKSDDGKYTLRYMHLAPGTIPPDLNNAHVKPGQKIGEMGNTGYSSGPHLHYQINMKNAPKPPRQSSGAAQATAKSDGWDINPEQLLTQKQYDPSLENYNYDGSEESENKSIFSGLLGWINDIKNKFLAATGLGALFGIDTSGTTFEFGNNNHVLSNGQYTGSMFGGGNISKGPTSTMQSLLDKHGKYLSEISKKYQYPLPILLGQIEQESGGNPTAKSKAGAVGLMQLMPGTAKDLNVSDRTDPKQSIEAGTRYMRQLLDRYHGNIENGLMAYNWGMGNVDKYLKGKKTEVPKEARDYAPKILARAERYKFDVSPESEELDTKEKYNENNPTGDTDIGGTDSSFFINDAFSMIFNTLQKNRESVNQQEFVQQQKQTQNSNNYRSMITDALSNIITSDSRVSGNSILSSILTKDNIGAILNPKDNSNINLRDTIRSSISTVVSDSKFVKDNSILSSILNKDNLDKIMSNSPSQRRSTKKSEDQQKRIQRAEISKSKPNYDDPEYINRRWKEITEKYNQKKASEAARGISTILPETLEAKIQKLTEKNPEIAKDKKKDINTELMQQMISLLQQVVGNTGASNNILDKINSKEFTANIELPKQTNNMQNNRSNNRGVAPNFTNKQTLSLVSHLITGR